MIHRFLSQDLSIITETPDIAQATNVTNPLAQFGVPDELFKPRPLKFKYTRPKQMRDIVRFGPKIIKDKDSTNMLKAATVLRGLEANGIRIGVNSVYAIGDTLGAEGFRLPKKTKNGKTYYALHCVGMSEEEKQRVQELLDGMTKEQVAAMKAA